MILKIVMEHPLQRICGHLARALLTYWIFQVNGKSMKKKKKPGLSYKKMNLQINYEKWRRNWGKNYKPMDYTQCLMQKEWSSCYAYRKCMKKPTNLRKKLLLGLRKKLK